MPVEQPLPCPLPETRATARPLSRSGFPYPRCPQRRSHTARGAMRPAASTQHAVLRVRAGRSVCQGFAPPGDTLQASVLHLQPAGWPSRAAFAVFLERTHSLSHPPAPPSRMATSSWVRRPPLLLRSFFSAESRLVLLEPKSHRLSPHMETLRPSSHPRVRRGAPSAGPLLRLRLRLRRNPRAW